MVFTVSAVTTKDYIRWDEFVRQHGGTVLQMFQFLNYHPKGRFDNRHLIFSDNGNVQAVMPAALVAGQRGKTLVSYPGASFGGIILKNKTLKDTVEVIDTLTQYAKKEKFTMNISLPPRIYDQQVSDTMEFALLRAGFHIKNQSLMQVIALQQTTFESYDKKTRNTIRKAQTRGVSVTQSEDFATFYSILQENKSEKNAPITHSLNELIDLKKRISATLFLASHEDKAIAGAVLFPLSSTVVMAFYIAHLSKYQELRAVDAVVHTMIEWSRKNSYEFLDLGTSTFGLETNWGLVSFKENFNAFGMLRKTFEL